MKHQNQTQPSGTLTCLRGREVILAAVRIFLIASSAVFLFSAHTPVFAAGLIGREVEIVQLTNELRQTQGLPILTVDERLTVSAQAKANDMVNSGYFGHADNAGRRVAYWLGQTGYKYLRAGENLARGFDTTEEVVMAWVNSPSHYANLINPNYQEIGVGIAEGYIEDRLTVFVVEHFGEPMPKFNLTPVIITRATTNLPSVLGENLNLTSEILPEFFPQFTQYSEAAIVNTSPVGLFWVAYGDAKYGLRQTIVPGVLASNQTTLGLPDRGYHTAQILFVALVFLGFWGWLSMLMWPIYAWLGKLKNKT